MKLLKKENLKNINKIIAVILFCVFHSSLLVGQDASTTIAANNPVISNDTIKTPLRVKADGVAAVVGAHVLLDSDLDKEKDQIKFLGGSVADVTDCEIFGKMLEGKLYAHHAVQDSLEVSEREISGRTEQQLNALVEQLGSIKEVVKFYKQGSEAGLRSELYSINKNDMLSKKMLEKIYQDIEITPEEVRQFFKEIPKEERPIFGTELQVSQIVIIPKVSEVNRQKVIDRLKEFKADVEDRGANFSTKALLYSDDIPSRKKGGKYTLSRKQPRFVKEFREVAFSLQEGEISEPFKTEFGYHIIQLEKIRGQEYDVRHVLLRPEIGKKEIEEAKAKIDSIRDEILLEKISFEDAALKFSDEKETKYEKGNLINPVTQDYNFELTKMDPTLYVQIQNLKDNELGPVIQDEDRINKVKFKIMKVSNRIDEHEADFSRDYLKIKNLALQDKQLKAISNWQDEKIMDTYIKVNGDFRKCNYHSNWLKN